MSIRSRHPLGSGASSSPARRSRRRGVAVASEPSCAELEELIRRLEQIIRENGRDQPASGRTARTTAAPAAAPVQAETQLEQSTVDSVGDDT